ncbi:MAG TPA: ABC transporter ATP-binding protein, partial [Chitinophagaceae bacterium]
MERVIKAEHISKAYQLGEFTTGTLSQDIERMWYRVRGKEDPFLKIGEVNDRAVKGQSDMVWSLKDINFEIQHGDAVGIIGRNGAGKSTLLKILSRVTSPTTGSIKVKGRIASLLEVGTGFHPELTGKENIFLNGAILGMRKAEIKRKFDEIVDFSGVERYIDTPVKRYSSGMYVRLAFAVAAHLESEILIVDEVLAVGDAEFQKKCLSKMNEVSKSEGRTILFVSHTMPAVKQLCNKSILLNKGQVELEGPTIDVINYYLSDKSVVPEGNVIIPDNEHQDFYFTGIAVLNDKGEDQSIATNENPFFVDISFVVTRPVSNVEISICFKNSAGINVFFTSLSDNFSG